MKNEEKSGPAMAGGNNLLSDSYRNDFTVDKSTKTVFITGNLMQSFRWYGMLLPNPKFLTNGGHLNPGPQKQKL